MPATLRMAVNGLGRIGRLVVRAACERPELELVAVNASYPPEVLARLLRRDSTHGSWHREVEPRAGTNAGAHDRTAGARPGVNIDKGTGARTGNSVASDRLSIAGREVHLLHERDPDRLPWREIDVDLVVESTGAFRTRTGAEKHLTAGARRVILTAPPSGGGIPQVVLGVNEGSIPLAEEPVLSASSCTTNCLAPVLHVLHSSFGVERGFMTTVHAVTGDQRMLDNPHRDPRRARSGLLNIVPTTSGAARAIGVILPELDGRVDGLALRVPTADVSMLDLTVQLRREAGVAEVNAAFATAAQGSLTGILAFSDEPLVSTDLVGDPHSAVVDGLLTASLPGGMVKVMAWYDNEWAYALRVVDLAVRLARRN